MYPIIKIGVTGGPCAGKSTLMARAVQGLADRGVKTLVVPESPTLLIASMGITPAESSIGLIGFQQYVLDLQTFNEKLVEQAARLYAETQPVVILCDRGKLDAVAYVGARKMTELLESHGETLIHTRDSYDAILYMVSAAKGAEEAYTLANNVARMETVEEAKEKDDKTLAAWMGHPHLSIIDNSTGFDEKIERAMAVIKDLLGIPISQEKERKFLIEMPTIGMLDKFSPVKSHIVQTYLPSSGDTERRVRQRGSGEDFSFFYTEKIPTQDVRVRNETEKRITAREYTSLLAMADPAAAPIHKDRHCFAYESQYLELDVYSKEKRYAIVEVETIEADSEVVLPPELKVVREVTGEPGYSNHDIAMNGGRFPN